MTDTIEAAQLADMICGCANREQHRRDVKLIEDYVAARLTAHTKALVDGAGDTRLRALAAAEDGIAFDRPVLAKRLHQAAATIAALKAEIKRLTEREAQAKLDGVRGGIEAAIHALQNTTETQRIGEAIRAFHALDAEAIAKGEG